MKRSAHKNVILVLVLAVLVLPVGVFAEADVVHPDTFGSKVSTWWGSVTHTIESWRIQLRDKIVAEQTRIAEVKPEPEPAVEEKPAEEPVKKPGVEVSVEINPGFDVDKAEKTAAGAGHKAYGVVLGIAFTIVDKAILFYGIIIGLLLVILRKLFHRAAPHIGSWDR